MARYFVSYMYQAHGENPICDTTFETEQGLTTTTLKTLRAKLREANMLSKDAKVVILNIIKLEDE